MVKGEKIRSTLTPWRRQEILKTAWDGIKKNEHKLCEGTRKHMYKIDFKSNTMCITTDYKIGRDFDRDMIREEEISNKIKEE